jgi:hypothetical protein
MRHFYIYKSKNSAVYILNMNDLEGSLGFYKTITISHKLKKLVFKYYLYFLYLFKRDNFLSENEIREYFIRNGISSQNFIFDEMVSFLISPTGDKVITRVNRNLFQKVAFGNSLDGVYKEAKIYSILGSKELNFFNISKISNIKRDEKYISFILQNIDFKSRNRDIIMALVEFFSIRSRKIFFRDYLSDLTVRSDGFIDIKYLQNIDFKFSRYKDREILLGLIHNDFKPWNIDINIGIQIYDFEECSFDGLALLDLINYYIDPILYKNVEDIVLLLESRDIKDKLNQYLYLLKMEDIDINLFIYCYLIERVIFWKKRKNRIYNRYIEILDYFLEI